MKTLNMQKRLASKVMGVGINKVWFDPLRLTEIKEAITKVDIESLIKDGAIKKRAHIGVKRRAGKIRQARKKKGRGRGEGRKKIIVKRKKEDYMIRIRNIRRCLKTLHKKNKISSKEKSKLMRLAKGGIIRSKKELMERIK